MSIQQFQRSRFYRGFHPYIPRGRKNEFARAFIHAFGNNALYQRTLESNNIGLLTVGDWTRSPQGHEYWFHWHWFIRLQHRNDVDAYRDYRRAAASYGYGYDVWIQRPGSRFYVGPRQSTIAQAPYPDRPRPAIPMTRRRPALVPPRIPLGV